MSDNAKAVRKLTASVAAIIILAICLAITTFALIWETVSVDNNLFNTGKVEIDLNGGQAVIDEHEYLFEPGMTVKKDFYIENNSTWDVYYKLYFDNVEGGLADVLEVKIQDGEKTLFSGTAAELTRDNTAAADDILKLNERRELQIIFSFPESAVNTAQGLGLAFDFCADAVQTKGNARKSFV